MAIALVIADVPSPPEQGGTAARYVPGDGHRSLITTGDGTITVTEHTRRFGIDGAFDAPVSVASAMLEQWGDLGVREAQFWRASRTEESGARTTDLYRLSDLGITQVATWGGDVGLIFIPELVVMPPNASPGDSWTAQGDALPGGGLTYAASASVVPITGALLDYDGVEISQRGGCIGVQFSLVLTNSADGATTTLDEGTAWCAGRGQVWSTGTINGEGIGIAELPIAPLEPRGEYDTPVIELPRGDRGLSVAREVDLQISDGFLGPQLSVGRYVLPARAAGTDLVLVDDQGDSLQRWALEETGAVLRWSGRPGGTIVAAASVGNLTVATTDRRQVAAYDAVGRRIWSSTTDELVIGAPAGAGRDPVVVTRAGTVLRLNATDGEALWSTSLGADGRGAPRVVGDTVLVTDERERVSALDVRTGEPLWRVDVGAVVAMTTSDDESSAVLATEEGQVVALSVSDGTTLWNSGVSGFTHTVVAAGGSTIVASDEIVLAVDPATGAELWRAPGAQATAVSGDLVVLLAGGDIVLRHSVTGAEIDRDSVRPSAPGVWRSLVVTGSTAVVVDATGPLQVWRLQ